MNSFVFWDITPCSLLKARWYFGGTFTLHLQGRRINQSRNRHESRLTNRVSSIIVTCLTYSLTLKMEAIYSSETSVDCQQATRHYIITLRLSTLCMPEVSIWRPATLFFPKLSSFYVPLYTGCFKKSFTTLKAYINLYRGHTQRFELS
jgi:hypothetical protein